MNTTFKNAFDKVIGIEGGYSDDPDDRGGKTQLGITEAVARAHGYQGDMRDLSLQFARNVYKTSYWDVLKLDDVGERAPSVAHELFDTAVNMGHEVAGEFLQRSLNTFNRDQTDYADIEVDSFVGPATLAAFNAYIDKRKHEGAVVLTRALNSLQGVRYIQIVEARPTQEKFAYGWFLHRVAFA